MVSLSIFGEKTPVVKCNSFYEKTAFKYEVFIWKDFFKYEVLFARKTIHVFLVVTLLW